MSTPAGPADAPAFPHLFRPLQIGPVALKNRIVSTGHDTVMSDDDGGITDRLVAYHEARAAGGAGLVVVQVAGVHPSAKYTSHVLMADTDDCIPGYRRLAEALHHHGCRAFGQLFHGGREVMESQDGSLPVSLAPSSVPNERFHVMPRAMPVALIREVVEGYGAAAQRLRGAGMDGVEIVASHGYLPAQFLNPHVNQRTDDYGGSMENRLRFLREAIGAVRTRVGKEIAVGLRISVDEASVEGLTAEDTLAALTLLEGDGQLDYVSVVAGTSATLTGSGHIVPPMNVAAGYTAPLAQRVKQVMTVPVIVAGRINQPQEAELVLAAGQADAVGMTRAMICDPEMPAKAEAGATEDIRACIACNQACIGHFHAGYAISCIQHPETGREQLYGIRMPARRGRDVMVVGGGPGGLKAAAVAAERGHQVTLYEAGRRVGGQVLLAERLPGRAEFGGAITNLTREAERAGVKIVTGVQVDAALVAQQGPDAVVLATGARPHRPALELTEDAVVLDAWDVVRGAALPSGRIVVADWRCDWIGLGVALAAAQQGRKVTLAVNGYHAGETLQQYVRDAMLTQAIAAGVDIVPLVRPYGADDDTVYLQHVLTGEPMLIEGVAGLVLAQGHEPVEVLSEELADGAWDVHLVGDCLAPRTVEEAVLEGLQVGSAL
ncbi:MAG: FAD-binding protein [Blastococcus sp.]|nr:FAD-binding protein [Blastococcus sp.]